MYLVCYLGLLLLWDMEVVIVSGCSLGPGLVVCDDTLELMVATGHLLSNDTSGTGVVWVVVIGKGVLSAWRVSGVALDDMHMRQWPVPCDSVRVGILMRIVVEVLHRRFLGLGLAHTWLGESVGLFVAVKYSLSNFMTSVGVLRLALCRSTRNVERGFSVR